MSSVMKINTPPPSLYKKDKKKLGEGIGTTHTFSLVFLKIRIFYLIRVGPSVTDT